MSLQQAPWFQELNRIDQARLLGRLNKIHLPKGNLLFSEGDTGESLYILSEGQIEIYGETPGGKQQVYSVLKEGDMFGEMSLLTGSSRSASARSSSDATVYEMDQETFLDCFQTHRSVSVYILKILSDRISNTNQNLKDSNDASTGALKAGLLSLPEHERDIAILSSYLPAYDCEYIAFAYLQEVNQNGPLSPYLSDETTRKQLKSAKEFPIDEAKLSQFLDQAETYYQDRNPLISIQIQAERERWEEALTYFDQLSAQDSEEWDEEKQQQAIQLLSQAPSDIRLQCFDGWSAVLEAFLVHDKVRGFSLLEITIEDAKQSASEQHYYLYELASRFCNALHMKQKAIEYLQLSQQYAVGEQGIQGDNQERTYALMKKKMEQTTHQAMAQKAGRKWGKNRFLTLLTFAAAFGFIYYFGYMLQPLGNLDEKGMLFIGISLAAVLLWIVNVIPDYIVALFMGMFWVLGKVTTPEIALSGFSSPVWFFMIFIFAIGASMTRSGLLYRLSLNLLKKFPKTYVGQMSGIALGGILFSPLVPSAIAKASMGSPIAWNIAEAMGFKAHDKGAAGLGLTAALFYGFTFPFFLTGSFLNILAFGLVPELTVSWVEWFIYGSVSMIVFSSGIFILIYLYFRPKSIPKLISDEVINQQLQLLGPMSREEKVTIGITGASIGMLIFQTWHGIEGAWILLIAFTLLLAFKVLPAQSIKEDFDWGFLLFIGMAFSFATVAEQTGFMQWMGDNLSIWMQPFMGNVYLFLFAVAIITLLIGFVIRGDPAFILLVIAIVPLGVSMEIHPWIVIFVIMLTLCPFFFPYQSSIYLTAYYSTEGKSFTHKQGRVASLFYPVVSILTILISIPFWKWLGLW